MQSIRQCIQQIATHNALIIGLTHKSDLVTGMLGTCFTQRRNFNDKDEKGFKFLKYNKVIYPPQQPGEKRRPGFVCNVENDIQYSPKKMWYIACLVRGMTVDEAIKQLSFLHQRGAVHAKKCILEAQRMAVEEHCVEYKSNLWVAESFALKARPLIGQRRHAKKRIAAIKTPFCHYFVRLEEGKPPKDYYNKDPKTGEQMLQDWLNQMHMRKIINSL